MSSRSDGDKPGHRDGGGGASSAAVTKLPVFSETSSVGTIIAGNVGTDVGEGSILDGLASVKPAKHRAQLVQLGALTVLDDCYNAAPASMRW